MAAGEVLFADGDETYDLIVILDGTAEIVQGYGRPGATHIAGYSRSEFLGEIGMLTGQRAYLTAVATSAGRVLAVPVAQLRDVMAHEPGLSDLILRTFLLRRRPQRLGQACRRRHRRRVEEPHHAASAATPRWRSAGSSRSRRTASRRSCRTRRLNTGIVHVNDQTLNNDAYAPFGGTGASGNGSRFGSQSSWDEFTQWQWVTARPQAHGFPF